MNITQADVAHLTDVQCKLLVITVTEVADECPGPVGDFWRRVAIALVRAVRERRRALLVVEADLVNGDDEGELVEPGSDPVADALEEMRESIRRGEIL